MVLDFSKWNGDCKNPYATTTRQVVVQPRGNHEVIIAVGRDATPKDIKALSAVIDSNEKIGPALTAQVAQAVAKPPTNHPSFDRYVAAQRAYRRNNGTSAEVTLMAEEILAAAKAKRLASVPT